MAMTFGTRGNDGHSLVRDTKKFKDNFENVNFKGRDEREPDRVKVGKRTFVYGAKD